MQVLNGQIFHLGNKDQKKFPRSQKNIRNFFDKSKMSSYLCVPNLKNLNKS